MDFKTAYQESPLFLLLQPSWINVPVTLMFKKDKYSRFLLPSIFATLNGQIFFHFLVLQ